jgi:hypothetical protein
VGLFRVLRFAVCPYAVEEADDFGGQPGRAHPQLGEGAGADEPGIGKLAREPFRVGERVDEVDPMPEDKRRRGDGLALFDGRGERSHYHAVQDGGDFSRIRSDGVEQRIKRTDTRRGQPGDDPGDQPQRGPGVVRLQQEGHERERRRRGSGLEHRHFQDQPANPLRRAHGGEQAHVGAKRDPAQHHLVDAELVKQAQHLVSVKVHAVGAGLPGFIAPAVTEQVEQHDAVAPGGQRPGQPAAEVGVEQDAVQPHEHPVSRAIDLVAQPVLAVVERMPRALRTGLQAATRSPPGAGPGHCA